MPRKNSKNDAIVCTNLGDPEFAKAIKARAHAEGITTSELIRFLLEQWVTGKTPSTSSGYEQGKRVGYGVAVAVITTTKLPDTYEEAVAEILRRKKR